MSTFFENSYYFEQLREFVPRDALAILDQQKQKVSKAIDDQVREFGKALAAKVDQDVAKARAEAEQSISASLESVRELMPEKGQGLDPSKAAALEKALDDYEAKWKGLGENLAAAAKKAVQASTGISI